MQTRLLQWGIGTLVLVILIGVGFVALQKKNPSVTEVPGGNDVEMPQWQTYSSPSQNFSISYPPGFTVNERYVYDAQGEGKEVPGVAFIIPAALSQGTNLSSDSYVSVEHATQSSCSVTTFNDVSTSTKESTISDGGNVFMLSNTGDAAAGNRYDVMVYRDGCTAIRYFIHSTNIGNYPEGQVREFDRNALISLFDGIRHTYRNQ